jgi:acyl-CoA synthetase (AMP-forming)/AMP-acid ligase II
MQGLMMNYPLTLDRILEHANRVYPHKRITTKQPDGSLHRYTYADLYKRVKRLANVLVNMGVKPGERVGTFAWNSYQHLELYYGIPAMGAICHTLNIRLFPNQLAYVINHAEDKVIFIDGTLLPLLERVVDKLNPVQHYVLFNTPPGTETKLPNTLIYEELMSEADEEFEWHNASEEDAVGLCYTSGTTGNPKGVLYSHRSTFLHTLGECHPNVLGLSSRDIVLPVVPQFHVMAWGLPYSCALSGAELVMPGPHLKPAPLAQLIEEEKVTCPAGVPSIWNALYHELKTNRRDLSQVRALVVGGSAMPRSLIEAYESELGVNVLHAWGMTEMSPVGTASQLQAHHDELPDHQKWDIKAKQGYVIAGVEMRLMNEQGEELPWDGTTMGEAQVRGPWVARQYYGEEPTPVSFTADGWFRTGDVATISDDGYMNITDRTKDLVKSGGEWISSVALENTLMAHPKILEAAVIAIPDEKWDERPLAAIVPAPDAGEVTAEELSEYLAPRFAKFWLPDKYVIVEDIPKTSVGKFDKKVLRHRYAEGELG